MLILTVFTSTAFFAEGKSGWTMVGGWSRWCPLGWSVLLDRLAGWLKVDRDFCV